MSNGAEFNRGTSTNKHNTRQFSPALELDTFQREQTNQTAVKNVHRGNERVIENHMSHQANSDESISVLNQNGLKGENSVDEKGATSAKRNLQDQQPLTKQHEDESNKTKPDERGKDFLDQHVNNGAIVDGSPEPPLQNISGERENASRDINGVNGVKGETMLNPHNAFQQQANGRFAEPVANGDMRYRGIIQVRNTPQGVVPFSQQFDHLRGRQHFFPALFQQNVSNNYTFYAPSTQNSLSESQSDLSSLPEDEYSGTNMSERSLNTLMSRTIVSSDDVKDLGLELDLSTAMIQKFLNQNQNNPQTAAFKLVLEWRNSRSTGSMEEKRTVLHDALVEMGKLAQAAVICSENKPCKHHRS